MITLKVGDTQDPDWMTVDFKIPIQLYTKKILPLINRWQNYSDLEYNDIQQRMKTMHEKCILCSTKTKAMSYPDDDYRCPNEGCTYYNREIGKWMI